MVCSIIFTYFFIIIYFPQSKFPPEVLLAYETVSRYSGIQPIIPKFHRLVGIFFCVHFNWLNCNIMKPFVFDYVINTNALRFLHYTIANTVSVENSTKWNFLQTRNNNKCSTTYRRGSERSFRLEHLTVDGIAMAISRMAPSHFLWKKPYKCWDTVSQLCRLRLK